MGRKKLAESVTRITLRAPEQLHQALKKQADRHKTTVSALVRWVMEQWTNNMEKKDEAGKNIQAH